MSSDQAKCKSAWDKSFTTHFAAAVKLQSLDSAIDHSACSVDVLIFLKVRYLLIICLKELKDLKGVKVVTTFLSVTNRSKTNSSLGSV